MKPIIFAAIAFLALAGCGQKSLSGTYVPKGGGVGNGLVMEKLEFASSDTVTITMMEQAVRVPTSSMASNCSSPSMGSNWSSTLVATAASTGAVFYGKFCKA